MNLFVAEKPSLARAIAEALGSQRPSNGCIYCANNNMVTWCFGHLLEVINNKGEKWSQMQLPVLPDKWLKSPKDASSAKQIKLIKDLASKSNVVINAGDPDREGQLLVDEVLEHIKYKGKVLRLWVQALDKESMQKALKNLSDNSKYQPLKLSAEARTRADWLVGVNLTIVYTLSAGKFVSIGRVQTPTLKLIADRDNTIANFKPKDYFVLTNKINNTVESTLITKELDKGIDEENRLIDKSYALSIAKDTSNTKGKVTKVKKEKKTQYPPMPFMLSTLQKYMSEHHGFSAKQTLNTLQALYEKKLTTYPRTDCAYLPEEQFSDSAIIIKNIENYLNLNAKPNLSIKHKAWDSSKLSAHHGIMPTKDFTNVKSLNSDEQLMFRAITKSFFCLFFEPYQYIQTTVVFNVASYNFQSVVNTPVNMGYLVCTGITPQNTVATNFKEGDSVKTTETQIASKQTTPPPHFTDGSLIEAMSHIHRFIDDEKAKSILKETDGIGTEATRAAIIETLIGRGFINRQGKNLISIQPFVNSFLKNVPPEIQNPVLTAQWESKLSDIANSKYDIQNFEMNQRQFVTKIVDTMKGQKIIIELPKNKQTNTDKQENDKQTKYRSNKQTSKTKRTSSTQSTLSCPDCGKPLSLSKTKNGKSYYRCDSCKSAFWQNSDDSVGKKWDIKLAK